MGAYLPIGGEGNPQGYMPVYDPMSGYGMVSQGVQAMQGIPSALANGAAYANQLGSQNLQASFEPQAQIAQAQIAMQTEALRQNAMNQRLGPLLQLLSGAFGNLKGGGSGFAGFSSTFGQGAQPGATAPGAPGGPAGMIK